MKCILHRNKLIDIYINDNFNKLKDILNIPDVDIHRLTNKEKLIILFIFDKEELINYCSKNNIKELKHLVYEFGKPLFDKVEWKTEKNKIDEGIKEYNEIMNLKDEDFLSIITKQS